jgi:hypothetical protein
LSVISRSLFFFGDDTVVRHLAFGVLGFLLGFESAILDEEGCDERGKAYKSATGQ